MTCETVSETVNSESCERRPYEAASVFASPVLAVEILSIASKTETYFASRAERVDTLALQRVAQNFGTVFCLPPSSIALTEVASPSLSVSDVVRSSNGSLS